MIADVVASGSLLALVALVGGAYSAKSLVLGASRFSRVDAAGSSAFLGPGAMHAGYWALMPVGRTLVRLGVSANAVTFASLFLAGGAGAALAVGHFGIGAALAALSALGDALDGLVARESHTVSGAGKVLDSAVDRYGEFLFLGGLAVFYREHVAILALVLFTLLGSFMVSYASAKAEALLVAAPRGAMRRAERALYLTAGAALTPIFGLWSASYEGWPIVSMLLLVAVVANVSAAQRLASIGRLATERDRDEAPTSERRPKKIPAPVRGELGPFLGERDGGPARLGSVVR